MPALRLSRNAHWLLGGGFLLVLLGGGFLLVLLGGVVGLSMSGVLTVTQMWYSALLVIAAVIVIIASTLESEGWGNQLCHVFIGVVYLLAGIATMLYSNETAIWFTPFIAASLLTVGVLRIVSCIESYWMSGRGWTSFAGICATLLSLMIILRWPWTDPWVSGVFLSVDIFMQGISFIWIGLSCRKA